MSRYFIHLSYDGTPYHGWQYQPNAITVQETLEKALSMMLRTGISLTGCGRTDTGVHARQFFAHFDTEGILPPGEISRLVYRLNGYLDKTISVTGIFPVPSNVHARFSALSRSYEYHIARKKDPFLYGYAHFLFVDLDLDAMNECAHLLKDHTDFTSFSKVDTDAATNFCRVTASHWIEEDIRLIFCISADRFLRNMVRAIVGTLLEVGAGKLNRNGFIDIIEQRDRSAAGSSVPASGLFLTEVVYPAGIVPDGELATE